MRVGNVEGAAIVTKDGLLVASHLPKEMDSGVFSAMSAAMHAAGETAVREFQKGTCRIVSAESDDHVVIAYSIDEVRLLVALFDSKANMGLIRLEIFKAAERLQKIF